MRKISILLLFALIMFNSFLVFGGGESESDGMPVLKAHFIGASPKDLNLVQDEMNKYLKEKYGVQINMTFTDFGDFNQKATLIVNTGEDYDIIFTSSWANDYLGNAQKGAFLDLTDYLNTSEFKPLYDVIDQGFWDGAMVNGKIYAIPTQKEIALMEMYLYNSQYLDETSFDYKSVKSLKDIEPYLAQVKKLHPDVIPYFIQCDRAYGGPFDYPLGFNVPILVDKKNKVKFSFDEPMISEYYNTVRDFFTKGYINQDAASCDIYSKGTLFGLSNADGQPYAELIWSRDGGFDISAELMSPPIATTASTRGSMLAINSNSKHPKEALKFLQAVNTDSTLHNMLNYGIEDIHYTKISENMIEKTERGDDYIVPSFALGNLFNTYLIAGDPEDKWEVFKQANAAAIKSELLGLNIDVSNIETELAAINNIVAQYAANINSGSVDTKKEIANYKQKLTEVGLQKVIAEVQKQVDNFLATK